MLIDPGPTPPPRPTFAKRWHAWHGLTGAWELPDPTAVWQTVEAALSVLPSDDVEILSRATHAADLVAASGLPPAWPVPDSTAQSVRPALSHAANLPTDDHATRLRTALVSALFQAGTAKDGQWLAERMPSLRDAIHRSAVPRRGGEAWHACLANLDVAALDDGFFASTLSLCAWASRFEEGTDALQATGQALLQQPSWRQRLLEIAAGETRHASARNDAAAACILLPKDQGTGQSAVLLDSPHKVVQLYGWAMRAFDGDAAALVALQAACRVGATAWPARMVLRALGETERIPGGDTPESRAIATIRREHAHAKNGPLKPEFVWSGPLPWPCTGDVREVAVYRVRARPSVDAPRTTMWGAVVEGGISASFASLEPHATTWANAVYHLAGKQLTLGHDPYTVIAKHEAGIDPWTEPNGVSLGRWAFEREGTILPPNLHAPVAA